MLKKPNNCREKHSAHRFYIMAAFSLLSVFSLSLGMGLCLIKSPQEKSDYYLTLADHYQQQAAVEMLQPEAELYLLTQAQEILTLAIRQTPYNARAWDTLSALLLQVDKIDLALQARSVASALGMPSLLCDLSKGNRPLARTLALSDPQGDNILMR